MHHGYIPNPKHFHPLSEQKLDHYQLLFEQHLFNRKPVQEKVYLFLSRHRVDHNGLRPKPILFRPFL